MKTEINAVIVTNVPAPYRVPVWRKVAQAEGISLALIFCAPPHIDTVLNTSDYGFVSYFLTGRYRAMERRFMHSDLRVWPLLNQLRPDVVITTGYIPTFLFSFAWAIAHGVPHIVMTDGTAKSEQSLSWIHRLVRRIVFKFSSAFIGACDGSKSLFRNYGVIENRIYKSCLCADNERFSYTSSAEPKDFIYCGRFVAHKRPIFALEVARETAIRLGRRASIDFVGSGEMEAELRAYADNISEYVDCRFLGYATQAELPKLYADAKIFLFPSEWDPWGVVANEACASGLPVIVSPNAGVAGELVVDRENGFIRELNIEQWAQAAVTLLSDQTLYACFSENCRLRVAEYNFDNSALGITNAIMQAYFEQ